MHGIGARARFDDLVAGAAVAFDDVERELVAWSADEVPAVLDEAQRLSDHGSWAFGYVSYEAAQGLDSGLATAPADPALPMAWFGISPGPTVVPVVTEPVVRRYTAGPWVPAWTEAQHADAVEAVRELVAAGDTYQCNLTTTMTSRVAGDVTDLYRDLALGQRGRFNAFLDLGRHVVASASPELFFERTESGLSMRPMKGTAARGRTPAEDDAARARLAVSAKDRAENVMIVDLVRNDLARIARVGSVRVTSLCRMETYETVHQLTSDVSADVDASTSLSDIFRALFPCGSITGAPKQRTMEIITDLEDGPRGIYCGAIGMLAPAGSDFRARFSVAIRTVVVDRVLGTATYGTGGGITWSSRAEDEYAELLTKTRVLDALHGKPFA
ncbi:aminodeoxychorismate synthase component I [Actinomycetes bacterium M1A6_2h]